MDEVADVAHLQVLDALAELSLPLVGEKDRVQHLQGEKPFRVPAAARLVDGRPFPLATCSINS